MTEQDLIDQIAELGLERESMRVQRDAAMQRAERAEAVRTQLRKRADQFAEARDLAYQFIRQSELWQAFIDSQLPDAWMEAEGEERTACPECGDYLSAGYCESCGGAGEQWNDDPR